MLLRRRRKGAVPTWTDFVQLAGYLSSIIAVGITGQDLWDLLGNKRIAWTSASMLSVGLVIWCGVALHGMYLMIFRDGVPPERQ